MQARTTRHKIMNKIVLLLILIIEFSVLKYSNAAAPSIDDVENYKKLLSNPKWRDEIQLTKQFGGIREILDKSLEYALYSVLEAALSNEDIDMRGMVINNYLMKVPLAERKAFLVKALLNERMWPAEDKLEVLKISAGNIHYLYLLLQEDFAEVIKKTFDKPVDFHSLWTSAQRSTMAESLRPQYTAKAPNPGYRPDSRTSPSVRTTNDNSHAISINASRSEVAEIGAAVPRNAYAWMIWTGIAFGAAGITGLLVVRRFSRRKTRT